MTDAMPSSLYGAVDLSALGQSRAGAPQQGEATSSADAAPTGEVVATLPDIVINGGQAQLEELAPLSMQLPVLVEMYSSSAANEGDESVLQDIVRSAQGRLVLLRIDLDENPTPGAAPQLIVLLGGRPAPLANGVPPREQLLEVLSEVLAVAQQQGMTGRVAVSGEQTPEPKTADRPLPPLHREAQDALEAGDLDAAHDAYRRALDEAPADEEARIGMARVDLLRRLRGKTLQEIRDRAASEPNNLDAQLDVADLDLSGGHVTDAFDRLLSLFTKVEPAEKQTVRERLLELFEIVGQEDARVVRARQQLTNLLFS